MRGFFKPLEIIEIAQLQLQLFSEVYVTKVFQKNLSFSLIAIRNFVRGPSPPIGLVVLIYPKLLLKSFDEQLHHHKGQQHRKGHFSARDLLVQEGVAFVISARPDHQDRHRA